LRKRWRLLKFNYDSTSARRLSFPKRTDAKVVFDAGMPGASRKKLTSGTIGIPMLVDTDRPFCFQRHIAILKPSAATTPEFLRTLMGSPVVFKEAWARITGSAQPTLPLGNLRTIPIGPPPLAKQQEIVRRVEALFALADQIEARFTQARAQVDKLTPSLLARPFRGQLVPQDPTEEPASVLLERIQEKRGQLLGRNTLNSISRKTKNAIT
jgi:type I restriction enzyme S subunit